MSLKTYVIHLLCRPDFTVGTAATEFGNINAMRLIGPLSGTTQAVTLIHQRQDGVVTIMKSKVKAVINSLTHTDLCWLVDHGFPRNKIDRKPTKFLLYLYISRKS